MAGFNIDLFEVCAFTKVLIDIFSESLIRYFNRYCQPQAIEIGIFRQFARFRRIC